MNDSRLIHAVSGRPAFQGGGAGQLIGMIQEQVAAEQLPMQLICARWAYPMVASFRAGRIDRALAEPLRRAWDRRRLHGALERFSAQRNPLVVFHPQSLGLDRLLRAAERRTQPIWIYVLDCSFFCRRSYNSLPGEYLPCLRCLGNDGAAAEAHGCTSPFPRGHSAREQKEFRRLAQAGGFRFLTQTEGHAQLLRDHVGQGVDVTVIGLEVPGIHGTAAAESDDGFDLVYHAAPTWEKGVGFLFGLARALPGFRILAPFALEDIAPVDRTALSEWPDNLVARPMTWSSGLQAAVESAKCVLCPSLWSAPIEGAVLKSLVHNGVVAVFRERGQFGAEIAPEAVVALDARDIVGSADRLREVLRDRPGRDRRRSAAAHYMAEFREANTRVASRICRAVLASDAPAII